MAKSLLRLEILLLGLLLSLAACGRHEGPEPTFGRLRRAIEAQDGKAVFSLMSPHWQRLYLEWAEEAFADGRFLSLADRLNWSATRLQEAGPRGCLEALLLTVGDFTYTPEFLRGTRSLRTEWKAPDRAWIVAEGADGRPHAYVFSLEGGRWFWRPPNLPPEFLRRRP